MRKDGCMYFIDTAYNSLTKYGEELCGDHVEQVNLEDSKILVLSDGLGSGVKANILATMTSQIAATMLKEGSTLEETIDTIVHTLPIDSVRKLAYSTFTILKIAKCGQVYAAEFDNPSLFLYQNGEPTPICKIKRTINRKVIYESAFYIDEKSLLVAVSDGVIHAGVGHSLAFGWQWKNVSRFIKKLSMEEKAAKAICARILQEANNLYEGKPGDDTTVLAVKIRPQATVNLFTGPPKNPNNDFAIINKILNAEGKVVVCGGTTANIVARTLGCELEVDISTMTPNLPPIAKIPRIALVTEGVVTIHKAIELLQYFLNPSINEQELKLLNERNAAAMLAKLLIEECSILNIWMGQAVNPAHQEADFTLDFEFKVNQIRELAALMEKMGKTVKMFYI